jgi:hypothetical protein
MLKAQLAAITAVLDINFKLLRRRRDSRSVAANIAKARDFVQGYQGPRATRCATRSAKCSRRGGRSGCGAVTPRKRLAS